MTFDELLDNYMRVKAITDKMLMFAKNGAWEELLNLQSEYDLEVKFLDEARISNLISRISAEEQDLIKQNISEIINNQNQLQDMVNLHQIEIGELIGKEVASKSHIHSYNEVTNLE